MDRSLRRRGPVMVVAGALLGALLGIALGLLGQPSQPSSVLALADPGPAGAVAAGQPGGRSRTAAPTGSGEPAATGVSSGRRPAAPAGPPAKAKPPKAKPAKTDRKGHGGKDKGDGHAKAKLAKPGKD